LRRIAAVCAAFGAPGMRADLVLARTAVAHAAWRGAGAVQESDVRVAAALALAHRRADPFDAPGVDGARLQEALRAAAWPPEDSPDDPPEGPGGGPEGGPEDGAAGESASNDNSAGGGAPDRPVPAPAAPFQTRLLTLPGVGAGAPGRRSAARTSAGRTVRASVSEGSGLHLLGTLLAAAPHQRDRGRRGPGLVVHRSDVRLAVREGRESNLVLFAVDSSGSMAARSRMSAVTGAVLSLLLDAYQRRDKVGLISFRGTQAQLVLPPTSAVDAAATRLRALRTGGRTPLAAGLLRSARLLATERLRDPTRRALLVVLTDGRATHGGMDTALAAAGLLRRDGVASIVVDCESGPVRLGLPGRLALALGGRCVRLEELSADAVVGVVRAARGVA
jgi:magnesium chelatase subunit D